MTKPIKTVYAASCGGMEIFVTLKDKEKFDRLRKIFDDNYRVTHLMKFYLERCPEAITEDMIAALTDDGTLTKTEAVRAIVCELFGLDFDNADDRRIIKEYITPSVRVLDAEKYRKNKYYQNIKLENVHDGSWEIKKEAYAPYRAIVSGDIIFGEDFREIPPLAFFSERFEFPAVLEDGNEWMTLTPVDLDTSDEAIEAAHGKVVTFGLGLGYYAYMVSEKNEVESITVVERSEEVIRLFKKYILPQFEHREKVRIVKEDAFVYAEKNMPNENFDVAFVDIWRDGSDGAIAYKKMKPLEKLSGKTKFIYWIENFIISRLRSLKFEELYEGNKNEQIYENTVKQLMDIEELIK